jgi:copper resistance protein B
MEKPINFHMVRNEIDYGDSEEGGRLSWDAAAWIGGDRNKLWIKAEGEQVDRNGEQNEAWALYSRMISAYFDLQAGLRQDFEPETLSHVALGVQGLAPYMFETEAFAFVSENGDVSARFEQSIDLLLTQRLIAKPHVKLNAFAQDVPELAVGTGLSDLELGLQVRYEIERKFAPYVDLIWERKVGETASITRATGEDPSNLAIVGGIRFWF